MSADDSVKRAAVSLREEGLTVPEIATRLGVSERSVHRWIPSELKAEPSEPLSAEERRLILLLNEDECPHREIARTVGRSTRTIGRVAPARNRRGGLNRLIAELESIPDNLHDIRLRKKAS